MNPFWRAYVSNGLVQNHQTRNSCWRVPTFIQIFLWCFLYLLEILGFGNFSAIILFLGMYIFTMPILLMLSCVVIIPTWNPKLNKISQRKMWRKPHPGKSAVGFLSSVSTSWVWAWIASAKNPSAATFVEGLGHRCLGRDRSTAGRFGAPLKLVVESNGNPRVLSGKYGKWWNIISFGQHGWVFVWRYWSNGLIVGLGYGMLWVTLPERESFCIKFTIWWIITMVVDWWFRNPAIITCWMHKTL